MSLLSFGPVLHFAKIADQEDFSGRYETWDRRTAIRAFQPALARKGRPQGRPFRLERAMRFELTTLTLARNWS